MKVLALAFPSFTFIDLAGPMQAFMMRPGFSSQIVWHSKGIVDSDAGVSVQATEISEVVGRIQTFCSFPATPSLCSSCRTIGPSTLQVGFQGQTGNDLASPTLAFGRRADIRLAASTQLPARALFGSTHTQPMRPASAAQLAVISIIARSARSNATIACSSTPGCPDITAFRASLACAGVVSGRWCEKFANNTAPSAATASNPATRATALLTPEAMPAWASPAVPITVDVSGGTVIAIPTPSTNVGGNTPTQ